MESGDGASAKPRDARTVEAILRSMGVDRYDPRVVNQLLEILYRYVSSVLTDAREFSDHADKPAIDVDDVRLAIRSKVAFTFTQPPPRDVTMRLAAERNAIPLPPVDPHAGVALPPPEFQLTAPNYQVLLDSRRDKTPHASPKRPRLTPSPRRRTSASHTPDRTPRPNRPTPPKPKSAPSPVPMHIDTPPRKPADNVSPKGSAILPSAAPAASAFPNTASITSPVNTSSPLKRVGTPTRSPGATSIAAGTAGTAAATTRTSPKAPASSAAPDVIMLDPLTVPKAPTASPVRAAVVTPVNPTTPPTGQPAITSPKKTDIPPSASPPK